MAKLKYRNDIAPQIIEEARNRIFRSFIEKGYIGNTDLVPIKSIDDCSIEICSSLRQAKRPLNLWPLARQERRAQGACDS